PRKSGRVFAIQFSVDADTVAELQDRFHNGEDRGGGRYDRPYQFSAFHLPNRQTGDATSGCSDRNRHLHTDIQTLEPRKTAAVVFFVKKERPEDIIDLIDSRHLRVC